MILGSVPPGDLLRLIEGGRLRCPKDRQLRNVLAYKPFQIVEEFSDELNVVLKCPCGHIFSPGMSSGEMRVMINGD